MYIYPINKTTSVIVIHSPSNQMFYDLTKLSAEVKKKHMYLYRSQLKLT